jgi:ribosomal protein S6--L-glutamate ligase
MRLGFLSTAADSYSTRRLAEAARARGHEPYVLDTLRLELEVGPRIRLRYRGLPCPEFDALLPRIGASISRYGLAAVRHFEALGVPCPNGSEAIAASRDKLRALQRLCAAGVPVPQTAFVREREQLREAVERLGGPPVILKLLEGTQGVGVILAESLAAAEATVEALHQSRQAVLLQRFIAHSRGRDIRAIVLGGRVFAAMRREARADEFRSNIHRGAAASPLELSAAQRQLAERAAQLLGLGVAGVDLLEGPEGPLVNEVNSSPGLEGIEAATGLDVAGAVIRELESLRRQPASLNQAP